MAEQQNKLFTMVTGAPQPSQAATSTGVPQQQAGGTATGNIGQDIAPTVVSPGSEGSIIDVIKDMQITANIIPANSRLKESIPFVILDEYTQKANAILAQATYFARGLGFTSDDIAKVAGGVDRVRQAASSGLKDLVSSFAENMNERLSNLVEQAGNRASDQISNLQSAFRTSKGTELAGPLLPYNGLYARGKKQRSYILPYFADGKRRLNNNYSDSSSGFASKSMFNTTVKEYADKLEDFAMQLLAAAPGAYVEKFKSFSPSESPNTFTVDFDLINTIDPSKIQTHFDFIFLLLYQNLPFRKNMAEILPPRLYALTVPGEVYYPFCNISSIKIDCLGVKRMFSIKHPLIGSDVSASVPEVYSVSITVNPLTYDAANFMIADEITKVKSRSASSTAPPPPQTVPPPAVPTPVTNVIPNPTPVAGGGTVGAFLPPGAIPR